MLSCALLKLTLSIIFPPAAVHTISRKSTAVITIALLTIGSTKLASRIAKNQFGLLILLKTPGAACFNSLIAQSKGSVPSSTTHMPNFQRMPTLMHIKSQAASTPVAPKSIKKAAFGQYGLYTFFLTHLAPSAARTDIFFSAASRNKRSAAAP